MYVTSLFRVLPQSVSMEAIQEVETLPRATPASVSRVTTEERYEIQTQQRFSQQVRDAGRGTPPLQAPLSGTAETPRPSGPPEHRGCSKSEERLVTAADTN